MNFILLPWRLLKITEAKVHDIVNINPHWSIYQLFVFHETLAIHVHLGTAFLFKYCISPHNTGHVQTQTYCSNILLFSLKFTIPSRCCIPVLKNNQCYLIFTLLRCPHRIGICVCTFDDFNSPLLNEIHSHVVRVYRF